MASGRWFCRHCSGTLAFEKDLKTLPGTNVFFSSVRDVVKTSQERACPICSTKMRSLEWPLDGRKIEVDRCESCKAIWFDPGELKLLTDLTGAKQSHPALDETYREAARAILARNVEAERKNQRFMMAILAFCGLVLFGLYWYLSPGDGRYRAYHGGFRQSVGNPLDEALAISVLCVIGIFWKRARFVITIAATIAFFQCLLLIAGRN